MQRFDFIPKELIETKNQISQEHTRIRKPKEVEFKDSLMELIERVVSWDSNHVERHALALEDIEVREIALYLPYNLYEVDMHNLFEVFKIRATKDLYDQLYLEWQESYENSDCNSFLIHYFCNYPDFQKFVFKHNYTSEQFVQLLNSKKLALFFAQIIYNDERVSNLVFDKKMDFWGIDKKSNLYEDIAFYVLAYCSEEEYKSMGKDKILEIICRYDETELQSFIINYVKRCSLDFLYKNTDITKYLLKKTGEEGTNQFKNYFKKTASTVINKYLGLINDYRLYEAFGDDDRRRFWRQFEFKQYGDKSITTMNQAMIMEMGNDIVTEFIGQAMGPIYFFHKDIFEKEVKSYFRRCNNSELRRILYKNYESKNSWSYDRQIHSSGGGYPVWMNDVTFLLLRKYKITKRVVD